MRKRNTPMLVDPEFERLVKEVQRMIRKKEGENYSLREITRLISKLVDEDNISDEVIKLYNNQYNTGGKRKKKYFKMD